MSSTATVSDSSTPHTPSASSVITAVKASLGSPFFHAHLQEGRRIDYSDTELSDSHESSAFSVTLGGVHSARPNSRKMPVASRCEEQPRASRGNAEKSTRGARSSSSSKFVPAAHFSAKTKSKTTPTAAMPVPADDHDFWRMVADAQNPAPPTASRHYHYLTRSQSMDAGSHQKAPKMHKQTASYNAPYSDREYHLTSSPLREVEQQEPGPEFSESLSVDSGAPATWVPARGGHLSPIEEVNFYAEKHGETASLQSTTSAQSNLFIHRSVRRTPSTSTFNSANSTVPRSPDDPPGQHSTTPVRGYGRPFPAPLPVIPASPRESQNVFEPDPVSDSTYPMPAVYPMHMEYSAFQPPDEQDIGEVLPQQTRFAVPLAHSSFEALEELDLGVSGDEQRPLPRASMPHSRTPSLLSCSESVRTELTYLTAQDSAAASRRASAAVNGDLEAGRHRSPGIADGDTTLADPSSKKGGAAARLKASFDTLLSKSSKPSRKPTTAHLRSHSTSHASLKWLVHVQENLKAHAPWRDGRPAEMLFWTGFLAPWCWLIGGWMLARSGHTLAEGLPSGTKEGAILGDGLPMYNVPMRQRPGPAGEKSREAETPSAAPASTSVWEAAKNSSAELLASLRGDRSHVERVDGAGARSKMRAMQMQLRGNVPVLTKVRLDPWVTRCRVAAVVAGMFLLALCIVALIVLVRSL